LAPKGNYFAASLELGSTALTTEVVALTPVEITDIVLDTAASARLSMVHALMDRHNNARRPLRASFFAPLGF